MGFKQLIIWNLKQKKCYFFFYKIEPFFFIRWKSITDIENAITFKDKDLNIEYKNWPKSLKNV